MSEQVTQKIEFDWFGGIGTRNSKILKWMTLYKVGNKAYMLFTQIIIIHRKSKKLML